MLQHGVSAELDIFVVFCLKTILVGKVNNIDSSTSSYFAGAFNMGIIVLDFFWEVIEKLLDGIGTMSVLTNYFFDGPSSAGVLYVFQTFFDLGEGPWQFSFGTPEVK